MRPVPGAHLAPAGLLPQERPPPVGNSMVVPWGGGTGYGESGRSLAAAAAHAGFSWGFCRAGWRHRYCQATSFPGAAAGAGSCLPEVWARKLGCDHVPCTSWGKRLHPGSCLVVSFCNTIAEPTQDGQSGTRLGSEQCLCVCQALPATFPLSREGQILSIAPALKSLLPIAVRNSPGLGVSYLWQPVRKEECTELPRPPFPQPHALPSC